jgi:hypothetical protein
MVPSHGPAVELANGTKEWYLNGESLSEEEHQKRFASSCAGKVVEIDGIRYQLVEVKS